VALSFGKNKNPLKKGFKKGFKKGLKKERHFFCG
jgi:hypothetical protein